MPCATAASVTHPPALIPSTLTPHPSGLTTKQQSALRVLMFVIRAARALAAAAGPQRRLAQEFPNAIDACARRAGSASVCADARTQRGPVSSNRRYDGVLHFIPGESWAGFASSAAAPDDDERGSIGATGAMTAHQVSRTLWAFGVLSETWSVDEQEVSAVNGEISRVASVMAVQDACEVLLAWGKLASSGSNLSSILREAEMEAMVSRVGDLELEMSSSQKHMVDRAFNLISAASASEGAVFENVGPDQRSAAAKTEADAVKAAEGARAADVKAEKVAAGPVVVKAAKTKAKKPVAAAVAATPVTAPAAPVAAPKPAPKAAPAAPKAELKQSALMDVGDRYVSMLPKAKRATLAASTLAALTPAAQWELVVACAEADTAKVRAVTRIAVLEANAAL